MYICVYVFFFQAEGGIRDLWMWLEFRRELLQSDKEKIYAEVKINLTLAMNVDVKKALQCEDIDELREYLKEQVDKSVGAMIKGHSYSMDRDDIMFYEHETLVSKFENK